MSSILKVDTIQDQSGNNIINESGNVITIGASGDTITVPAGATVSGFTSAGIDDNATSVAITIDSSERVSIGTSTAEGILKLDNTGQTSETLLTLEDTGGSGAHTQIALKNTTGVVASILTTSDNLEFRVDDATVFSNISGSEHMRITSAGNVGIGTSSPGQTLTVAGDLTVQKSGDNLKADFSNGVNANFRILTAGTVAQIGPSTTSDVAFVQSSNEYMRIKADGKIGIGTSSPNAQFQTDVASATIGGGRIYTNAVRTGVNSSAVFSVRADNASGSSSGDVVNIQGDGVGDLLTLNNNGTDRVTVQADGKVGIGTSAPVAPLVVSNGGASGMEFHPELTTNTNRFANYNRSGGAYNKLKLDALEYQFFLQGNEHVRLNTNGILSAAQGIALGVGTATTASNVLDDYEEGTFTPTWAAGASGSSYQNQSGRYTKIGNQCFFQIQIQGNGLGATTAHLRIGGLPFTSKAAAPYGGAAIGLSNNFRSDGDITAHIGSNGTELYFYQFSGSNLLGTEATNINASLLLHGQYIVN